MCFSYDDSAFPTDHPETSETTPTHHSAPNLAELAAARPSGVMTRRRSRSMGSAVYNGPTSQREYHQPAQSLHDVTPFNPLDLIPSPHNSSHPTTIAPNQMPSSPGHFTPYIANGSPTGTYPAFSPTTQQYPASSSSTNFTHLETFPHPYGLRNMYPDIRTHTTNNQWWFQTPQHPLEGSSSQMTNPTAHPSEFGQFSEHHNQFFSQPSSTQDAFPSPSSPATHPVATPSPRLQTSSSAKSSRRTRKKINREPCRACKRSHLRCEIRPNRPDLCQNCEKRGRKRCPTPEPQPDGGNRRRTRQRNRTVSSSSPAQDYTENPENDVDVGSTSEMQVPRQSSAYWMAHNPIFGNAASISRPSPYSEVPSDDFNPLVSPGAWSLLARPASGVQRLVERLHHDGCENTRDGILHEPASPHSSTAQSRPGSPTDSSPHHAPGS